MKWKLGVFLELPKRIVLSTMGMPSLRVTTEESVDDEVAQLDCELHARPYIKLPKFTDERINVWLA